MEKEEQVRGGNLSAEFSFAGQHPRPSLWLASDLGDHHGEDGDDHIVGDHSGFDDEVNIGVRMVNW